MTTAADHLQPWTLLPPPKGTCEECAVDHPKEAPHNQQSMHYQYHFYRQHGRWPTWTDAMAHCSDTVKEGTLAVLREHGVKI